MVKLLAVIGRRAELTHAQYCMHQITTHLEVVDRVTEFRNRLRRYMQNHLIVDPRQLAPIKGLPVSFDTDTVIEVWWDSIADMREGFEEPRYLEIVRPDALAFGDVNGAWSLTANDALIMERDGY